MAGTTPIILIAFASRASGIVVKCPVITANKCGADAYKAFPTLMRTRKALLNVASYGAAVLIQGLIYIPTTAIFKLAAISSGTQRDAGYRPFMRLTVWRKASLYVAMRVMLSVFERKAIFATAILRARPTISVSVGISVLAGFSRTFVTTGAGTLATCCPTPTPSRFTAMFCFTSPAACFSSAV